MTEEYGDGLITVSQIKELHQELLYETIREQIWNPFDSKVDFFETFVKECKQSLKSESVDEDGINEIKTLRNSFYTGVIETISGHYKLEFDMESAIASNQKLKDIAWSLYNFFVIKRRKVLANFIVNFICTNETEVLNYIEQFRKKKDVTTISNKKKFDDKDIGLIFANIYDIVKYIVALEPDMDRIMEYLNKDVFHIDMVNYLMKNSIINDTFADSFLKPITERESDGFDTVMVKVLADLEKKYEKGGLK